MIRVLVAEDELPLLRGISRMIMNLCEDFEVVKMAKTGREALDYLKDNYVDVVFTDINMPVIDGLKVLEYIHENMPETVSIVISGYQDFSYAQKAMQYGVQNYLVKPIDRAELKKLLEQLRDLRHQERKKQKKEFMERALHGESGIAKLMESRTNSGEKLTIGRLYPVYLVVKAFCIHVFEDDIIASENWENCRLEDAARAEESETEAIYAFYGRNPNEILFLFENEKPDIEALIQRVIKNGNICFPVAAAAGDPLDEIDQLAQTVRKLRKEIYKNWVYGKTGQVAGMGKDSQVLHLPGHIEESILYMAKNRQFREFDNILAEIRRQMRFGKITQYQIELTLDRIMTLLGAYQTVSDDMDTVNVRYSINDILVRSDNLEEIFEEFGLWCREELFDDQDQDKGALMERLDAYICEHYRDSINTKHLAARFGLVPSYLSKLFQNYKGITPNHYIQEIRLAKAKELLVSCPDLMTKDIAQMTGYADPSYFSKVLKKYTGMYPSEYRTAHAGEQS